MGPQAQLLPCFVANGSAMESSESDTGPGGRADVLLVDDDADVLAFLGPYFQDAGFRVETASSGNEALERLETRRPDAIVADVKLLGMSGYEFCRLVRTLGWHDLPFVFYSALTGRPERLEGLRAGADDYLPKSTDPEELLLRIRALLDRAGRLRALREPYLDPGVLSGRLGQISVADLFQMIALFRLSPVAVHFEEMEGRLGEVFISGGRLVHAVADGLTGRKAFFRVLSFREGSFRIERRACQAPASMNEPLESTLLTGVAQLDECGRLREALGPRGDSFELCYDPTLLRRPLDEPARRILELIETHHRLNQVLDLSPLDDRETLGRVVELRAAGLILPRADARAPWLASEAAVS